MMHPRAPADGYPIALLPSTDKRPPNTIMVKRRPFEYCYTNTVKLEDNVKQMLTLAVLFSSMLKCETFTDFFDGKMLPTKIPYTNP